MHLKEVDANLLVILDALLVDASVTRAATLGLLAQFPLCFGYWQRVAKLEMAQTAAGVAPTEAAKNMYARLEAGLRAIPHSHELWTFYVTELLKNEAVAPTMTPEEIRRSAHTHPLWRA